MGYLENSGLYFGFTVVLPGDPFKVELDATGHFRLNEKVTQEDAALEMLGCVLEIIGNKIYNFNYEKVKLLHDSNNALRERFIFGKNCMKGLKLVTRTLLMPTSEAILLELCLIL
ncbi:hypothetical protein AHAS_Ahas15G0161000 [Arachis hypogaea]